MKEPNGNTIRTQAYTLPQKKHNLLSLVDVVDDLGEVAFTSTRAYATQPDKLKTISVPANILATQKRLIYTIQAKIRTCTNTLEIGARAI